MSKVIVVYGGGFQPFHAGHLSSYLEAKEAFPNADFYVAASNDTKTRPIPFNDKQFLAQQAGVSDPFVQVKMPINPTEILDKYSPKKDIFILVRSERDPMGYTKKDGSPGYFQPFVSLDKCEPFGYHGYVFVTHKKEFKLNGQVVYSGTQVRDMYANSDDQGRLNIIKQLYPRSSEQDSIKQMLDKYIGSVEPTVEPGKSAIKQLKAKKLKEQIQRMRPLIKEASIEQKYKMLKLIKEATQLDELNLFGKKVISKDKLAQKPQPVKAVDDYRTYFSKTAPPKPTGTVYHGLGDYYDKTKKDAFKEEEVDEGNIDWKDIATTGAMFVPGIGPAATAYNVGKNLYKAGVGAKQYSDASNDLETIKSQQKSMPKQDTTVTYDPDYKDDLEPVNELRDETIHSYLSKADRQISNRLDRMSQARERLNKNYEIYDVNNPAKIIDKFEANTPELAREYYYKFIKEFNPGDQDFHFEVRRSTGLMEDKEPKITNVVIDFYKPVVDNIQKEKVDDYVEQARELMHKAPDNNIREKLIDIFKKGKTNPYLQGGIITTVGALLAGGVLSSSQNLGLNPAQTNLALQAILNTVIPTIVSRVNGKNWIDTIKYTLASAGVGTGIAGAGLLEDNTQDYLEEK